MLSLQNSVSTRASGIDPVFPSGELFCASPLRSFFTVACCTITLEGEEEEEEKKEDDDDDDEGAGLSPTPK